MRCERSYNEGRRDLEAEILQAKPARGRIQDVKQEVCSFYNVPWECVILKSRKSDHCLFARQAFCYASKALAIASDDVIADEVGLDRSTVRHNHRLIKNLMDVQPEIKSQILHILNRLK